MGRRLAGTRNRIWKKRDVAAEADSARSADKPPAEPPPPVIRERSIEQSLGWRFGKLRERFALNGENGPDRPFALRRLSAFDHSYRISRNGPDGSEAYASTVFSEAHLLDVLRAFGRNPEKLGTTASLTEEDRDQIRNVMGCGSRQFDAQIELEGVDPRYAGGAAAPARVSARLHGAPGYIVTLTEPPERSRYCRNEAEVAAFVAFPGTRPSPEGASQEPMRHLKMTANPELFRLAGEKVARFPLGPKEQPVAHLYTTATDPQEARPNVLILCHGGQADRPLEKRGFNLSFYSEKDHKVRARPHEIISALQDRKLGAGVPFREGESDLAVSPYEHPGEAFQTLLSSGKKESATRASLVLVDRQTELSEILDALSKLGGIHHVHILACRGPGGRALNNAATQKAKSHQARLTDESHYSSEF